MPDNHDAASTRPRGWTVCRSLVVVFIVATLVRLACLASIPLIITNDGEGYLTWAVSMYEGHWPDIPSVRTPGYSLFLAGVFTIVGITPVAVLVVHHVLGIGTALLVTLLTARLTTPLLALLPGLVASLDPWLLAHENYALSEPLTVFLLTLAVVIALRWAGPRWLAGFVLGVLIGALCLVRPANQILLPFLALAWALNAPANWRRRAIGLVALAIGFGATVWPWLHYNRQRGINGMANGLAGMQWMGLARFQLLDWDYPIGPGLREDLAAFREDPPYWNKLPDLAKRIGAFDERSKLIAAWNRHNQWTYLREYLHAYRYALLWQLNCYADCTPQQYSELMWYVRRVGRDGTNIQVAQPDTPERLEPFVMTARGGLIRPVFRWIGQPEQTLGIPQIPFCLAALLVCGIAALRRNWSVALIMAGTFVFVLIHASTLMHVSRYTMPMWVIWFLALALLPYQIGGLFRRSRARGSSAPGPVEPFPPAPARQHASGDEPPPGHESN